MKANKDEVIDVGLPDLHMALMAFLEATRQRERFNVWGELSEIEKEEAAETGLKEGTWKSRAAC